MEQKRLTSTFPTFDTLHHEPMHGQVNQNATFDSISYTTTITKRGIARHSILQSHEDILQAYASFIGKLTGEEEVVFRFDIPDQHAQWWSQGIALAHLRRESGDSRSAQANQWSLSYFTEGNSPSVALSSEFAIRVCQDNGVPSHKFLDFEEQPFVLEVVLSEPSKIQLSYENKLMSQDFASSLFTTLVQYLTVSKDLLRGSSTTLACPSVLNFPCSSTPPVLNQDSHYKSTTSRALLNKAFERRAREFPDHVALDFLRKPASATGPAVHETFTYSELDSLSTALALHLRPKVPFRKDGKQMVIAAYLTTSPELYIAWLGVLKAGFVFSPISIDSTATQLTTILEDISATIVLGAGPKPVQGPWSQVEADKNGKAYTWIDVEKFVKDNQDDFSPPLPNIIEYEFNEESLAYVMYTSGSTGKAKGVQISHLAATCSIASHAQLISNKATAEGFRWFQFAAPTFDPSVMEIFVTLSTGGTLVAAPRDMSLSDPELVITELAADIMMATPSLAQLLRPSHVSTLRSLWTMGELLNRTVIENFAARMSQDSSGLPGLLNAYGPTEASINCTLAPNISPNERGSVIGIPTKTCSLFVIEPSAHPPTPVPIGFVGELAIGGPQLSIGYLNRPEQTSTAFETSPEFGRLYRTGDRVRVVKDKSGVLAIEFLGRLTDDQVKLSGRRVELGAIEAVFAPLTSVRQVVACIYKPRADVQGSERVAACIVPRDEQDEEALVSQLRNAANAALPAYMQPSKYFILSKLPRSTSGKADRKAATEIVRNLWSNPAEQPQDGEPGTESSCNAANPALIDTKAKILHDLENVLVELLQISRSKVSPDTDLLSIGVDSLLAVAFLQRLRAQGINGLSVADILNGRNLRAIANVYEQKTMPNPDRGSNEQEKDDFVSAYHNLHSATCAKVLSVSIDDIEKVLPTTTTQSGIISSFIRSTAEGSSKRYINHSVYYLAPELNLSRIAKSFENVLQQGEIWRTVFVQVDDEISPFSQCIISPSNSLSKLSHHTFVSNAIDGDIEKSINDAMTWAENSIILERPPLTLAVVRSPSKSAIVLSLFHGIFDGGSLQLLIKDVEDEYNSRAPGLRTQVECAVDRHFSSERQNSAAYWSNYLADFSRIGFPHINPARVEIATTTPNVVEIVAQTTMSDLKAKSQQSKISSLAVMQAAWASILLAYTGSQSDICFGSVISDRFDENTASCLAPTFVTHPVRVSLNQSKSQSVAQVASNLTASNAEALKHLHVPLGSVVIDGQLPYDTLFAFQRFPEYAGDGSMWSSVKYPPMDSDFGIMIEIWPTVTDQLRFRVTFKETHLDHKSAEVMLQQLDQIVQSALKAPQTQFSNIWQNLDSAQLSATAPITGYPTVCTDGNQFLHSAFEVHAKRRPNDIALFYQSDLESNPSPLRWTYSEMDMHASMLSQHLSDRFGPLQGQIVLLCMTKSPELYISILAVLKAGAAWCPVDVSSPSKRQHEIMSMAGGNVLLVAGSTVEIDEDAIPIGVAVVDVSLGKKEPYELQALPEASQPSLDLSSPAYLIFTSGTTGKPKGVPITHKAAVTAIDAIIGAIPSETGPRESMRCIQFSQYTFDIFVQDLFYTWGVGGALVSSPQEIMLQSFPQLANSLHATHAHLTPAFSATVSRDSFKTLQVVTMIGEKLTQFVADDWSRELKLFNTYGPAEATILVTYRQIQGPHDPLKSCNIGIPLPTVGTYVLRDGEIILKNGIGELALSGDQLSLGYWNNSKITAEKFIWNDAIKQKLYLTGDIVRMFADGSIEFVGRNDDLVKLGGIRVELSEISFSLRNFHKDVKGVEVLQCQKEGADTKLVVAFVACPQLASTEDSPVQAIVTKDAAAIARRAMEHAQTVLPEYMIPAVFVVVSFIPRTASAKVDRKTLNIIFQNLDLPSWENLIQPDQGNALQQRQSWANANFEILLVISNISRVPMETFRPNSTLNALGVDSIGAIRLAQQLRSKGHDISIRDLLKCRTLLEVTSLDASPKTQQRSLVKKLQTFSRQWKAIVSDHIGRNDISVFPATVLQQNLLSETLQSSERYWSNHFFSLHKSIQLDTLKNAWEIIASSTEALRIGFIAKASVPGASKVTDEDGSPFLQVLYPTPSVDWSEQDVEESLQQSAKQQTEKIHEKHQNSVFVNPLWAVSIFKQGDHLTMMLTIHHSIHDGPSLTILENNLRSAYLKEEVKDDGLAWTAAASITSFASDHTASIDFWKKSLEEFVQDGESSQIQSRSERSATPVHRSMEGRMKLSLEMARKLAFDLGANSVASVLRVAFGTLLTELMEGSNILFAEVISDRIIDGDLENAVGPLISVVPVPFKLESTAKDTVYRQDIISKGASQHRAIRPAELRSLLGVSAGTSLYPAIFTFHPYTDPIPQTTSSLWTKNEDILGLSVEHPIAFNVWHDSEDNLLLDFSVEENIMTSQQQSLFLELLDALTTTIFQHPDESMTSLTNHFPLHLRSVTRHRENTNCPPNLHPTFWLEHWASTHPNWLAAEIAITIDTEAKNESWNYIELNNAANQIANFISKKGISKSMIAMCLGRTLLAYAVIVGIMKSGNTYVPIDETFPDERKEFMVQDGDVTLVFTTPSLFAGVKNIDHCEVINVDDPQFSQTLSAMDKSYTTSTDNLDDTSYLLYTSGSTGKPKGVLVTNRNLSSFSEAQSEFICAAAPATRELGGKGKYLGLASRAFDVHIGEVFLAWRHGLAAVSATKSMLLDDLGLALSTLGITHASFVPSLLDQTGLTPEDAPGLVFVGVGGEKMSAKTKKLWATHHRVSLVNAYGPTEVTIGCCSGQMYGDTDVKNIGRPLGDSIAHILVPGTNDAVKRGMPGELCFTGSLVAKGYLKRPDAKGFVEDYNGERMYRTGDIVRLMPDDSVEFLGRKDGQVKIRGQRVELVEVSEGVRVCSTEPISVVSMILKHPGLSRPQLITFVSSSTVARQQNNILPDVLDVSSVSDLRTACQEMLASFMVPDVIVPLTYIPLAATSGKSDEKLLAKIFFSIPLTKLLPSRSTTTDTKDEKTGPAELTREEKLVCRIIKEVVPKGIENIGPDVTMFELGVDSLSAISVFSKMRKEGYQCTVAMILQNPSIRSLAALPKGHVGPDPAQLKKTQQDLAATHQRFLATLKSTPAESVIISRPCLPSQEVIVARSLQDESISYINHILLQLDPDIDIQRLQTAISETFQRNEILRTCFVPFESQILQVVLSTSSELPWVELGSTDSPQSTIAIEALQMKIATEICTQMTEKPPFRITVWKDSNPTFTLQFSIHHGLYDGISLAMLFDEIWASYQQKTIAPRPGLQSIVEYIAAQDKQSAKEYWMDVFDKWENTRLLADMASDRQMIFADRTFAISCSKLEERASSLSMTLPTLLQGIFGIALAQFQNADDLFIGAVVSGRSLALEEAESVMAPCIATVPQRIDLKRNDRTILDYLTDFQRALNTSLEYQHTSIRDIQRWVGANRPLYDCLCSFIKGSSNNDSLPWKQIRNDVQVDYTLGVEFESNPIEDTLVAHIGLSQEVGTVEKAEVLLENIEILVDSIFNGRVIPIKTLGLSSSTAQEFEASPIWNEDQWSKFEQDIRTTIASFCNVPPEQIQKSTLFIHLGIDSVTVIRLARNFREKGVQLSSADLIRHNCIGALSTFIELQTKSSTTPGETPQLDLDDIRQLLKPRLSSDDLEGCSLYPCTPLQQGMILQTLASDGKLYVHHHAFQLSPEVDLVALKSAWLAVMDKDDILRTSFYNIHNKKSSWVGVVRRKSDQTVVWHETTVDAPTTALSKLASSYVFTKETDFEKSPHQVNILTSKEDRLMVISMHHSLYDGMSIQLLIQQLALAYSQQELPKVTPFYEAAQVIAQKQEASLDFWVNCLRGYQSIDLPGSSENENVEFHLSELSLSNSALAEACRVQSIALQDVCLVAFSKALSCLVGKRDICFGHVLHGRNLSVGDGQDIIGPMFNAVPFRIRFDDTIGSNENAVRLVRDTIANALDHQHASLSTIQKRWHTENPTSTSPLIDSLFTFQKLDTSGPSHDNLWKPWESGEVSNPTEYGLNFEVEQTEHSVTARVFSNIGKPEMETLLERFKQSVQDILDNPRRFAISLPQELRHLPLETITTKNDSTISATTLEYMDPIRYAMAEIAGVDADTLTPKTTTYSLGLDSIAAIQIASNCRRRGVQVKLTDIIRGVTLGRIAELAASRSKESEKPTKPVFTLDETVRNAAIDRLNVSSSDVEEVLPCLAGQDYHVSSWLQTGRTLYEPAWTYQSRERLNPEKLQAAWLALQQVHPILRTTLVNVNPNQVVQVVFKHPVQSNTSFKLIKSTQDSETAAIIQAKQEARLPSDLSTPPIRLRLIQANDEDVIQVLIHHSLYDAWTMPRLISDLSSLYQSRPLDNTTKAFSDLVHYTISSLAESQLESTWKDVAANWQPTIIPSDTENKDPSRREQTFYLIKSNKITPQQLEDGCRINELSVNHLLLLAFARTLTKLTGSPDPLFGFFQFGRTSDAFPDDENVSGPCVNVLPLGVPAANQARVKDVIHRLQDTLQRLQPLEQSNLRDIAEWIGGDDKKLPFNSFINILWNRNLLGSNTTLSTPTDGSESDSSASESTVVDSQLFTPFPIGPPTDFSSSTALAGSTAVNSLNTSYLPDRNFFVDIGPDWAQEQHGQLVIGVRCDRDLMDEDKVKKVIGMFEDEIIRGLSDISL